MKKLLISSIAVLSIFLVLSCSGKSNNEELTKLQTEIELKDKKIAELENKVTSLQNQITKQKELSKELEKRTKIEKIITILGTGISNTYIPFVQDAKFEDFDLSTLNDEERDFYRNFAGSYFSYGNQEQIRHQFSCKLEKIENGIGFFALGNSGINIFYNMDNHTFYESDGITADHINYKTYKLSDKYKKISLSGTDGKEILQSEINYAENIKIQKLLENFFTNLAAENYKEIIKNCYNVSDFKNIRYDLAVEKKTEEELTNDLDYLKSCFAAHNNPTKIYSNLFFSEDKTLYDSIFSDYTLIEFGYPDIYNYFSFVVKKINGEYKIISYRNELNMM